MYGMLLEVFYALEQNLLTNGMLITKKNWQLSPDPLHNEAEKCICYKYVNKKMVKKVLHARHQFSRLHRHILRSTDLSYKKRLIPKGRTLLRFLGPLTVSKFQLPYQSLHLIYEFFTFPNFQII
jgi:hypothetical protein